MSTLEESVLLEADRIINGERRQQYGEPEDCFELIANYWNQYIDHKRNNCKTGWYSRATIDAHDVAMMMCLFKIARTAGDKKRDNYVDICGYAAIASKLKE